MEAMSLPAQGFGSGALTPQEQRWSAQVVTRSILAAFVVHFWDVLLTFPDEVACIWTKPRCSWTKWLFLVTRYLALFGLLVMVIQYTQPGTASSSACTRRSVWEGIALQLLFATVDILLMMRVYALYNRSLRISRFLMLVFILSHSTMAFSLAIALPKMHTTSHCILISSPPSILYFTIASVGSQSILFALTAYKFARAARAGWGNTALIALLMRDGTWAFALVFATVTLNTVFFLASPTGLTGIAFPWLLTVASGATCRLVLNTHAVPPRAEDDPLGAYSRRARENETAMTDTRMEFTTRFATGEDFVLSAGSYAGNTGELTMVRPSGDTSAQTLHGQGSLVFAPAEDVEEEERLRALEQEKERYETSLASETMSGVTAWSAPGPSSLSPR